MESGAATRSTKTRAKGGQSLKNQRKARKGTTEVDTAALERLLAALTAMRDGNFRKRLTVSGDGVMAEIAAVFNEVADRNLHVTGELARVRRVVGREGKLTERLETGPCEGSWAAAIENSNALVDDLVRPVSEVSRVLSAVAEGDLSPRMELRAYTPEGVGQPLRGEFLKVGRTVNNLVDQLSAFTDEVTRVASEVGTEGKLGGQARVRGLSGSWKDLTDSVNTMASRLTAQVRDIALVTTAVAKGDLSKKVTVDVAGEMLELKNTVNTMVDQLSAFSSEVRHPRRSGACAGRGGHLEGPHRLGEPDGRQPDGPGARDRAGHHRRRQRRPVAEGDRAGAGRGGAARRDDQPDDRDAADLRGRGHAGGQRGRRRGAAGRSGECAGGGRHLEGPHGFRQHGVPEPDHPGEGHRRRDDGRGQR
ncbi:hypothetical protein GCM10009564_35760 [Streptomyces thermogriseus]|uniref:HAMP domain-containing protein n=1 Tax=Streptomyces thermogriseus TaxID=75292 RepID=A0ABP4DJC2_9ACTN